MALTTSAINSAFRTVFAREASESELTTYANFNSAADLAATLYLEAEYSLTTLPVARLFHTLLDRAPEPEAVNFYVDAMRAGLSLHTIANSILASAEADAKFDYDAMDDATYVQQLYITACNREGEEQGVTYYVARLESGVLDRAAVAMCFANSPEVQLKVGVREYPAEVMSGGASVVGVQAMQTVHAFASGINTIDLALSGNTLNYMEMNASGVADLQAAVDTAEANFNGNVRFVFLAGAEHGYLIGDLNGDNQAETAVTLTGLNDTSLFAHSDIV